MNQLSYSTKLVSWLHRQVWIRFLEIGIDSWSFNRPNNSSGGSQTFRPRSPVHAHPSKSSPDTISHSSNAHMDRQHYAKLRSGVCRNAD